MSSRIAVVPSRWVIKRFRSPGTVIGRFVARRTVRSAAFLALVFGLIVLAKSAGYAAAYPTPHAREALTTSFSTNIGLSAIFGIPRQIQTVAGFAVWNTLSIMVIFGGIWALLTSTRTLRGEEDAGRWELLLAGQTTARRAALNTLLGLGASLAVLYIITAASFIAVGRIHSVNFGVGASFFFALAAVAAAVEFMAVGALASQLMPTRARAARFATAVFGVCFLVRAMADTTGARWLLDLSPLGWIERLQPLYGSQPIWLLPLGGLVVVLCVFTVYLAGRRDLGASVVADRESARPHTRLLGRPITIALRLTRAASLSWLIAVIFVSTFFGLLTKSAAQAFDSSVAAERVISHLTHSLQDTGAKTFLGVVFFLLATLVMAYVASAVGAMREDEADGYLDNLLVRAVGRLQWLWGRVGLIVGVIILAGLLGSVGAWIGETSQGAGVTFGPLLSAGINVMAPAIFVLGIGILALGLVPRLTTVIAYSAVAWSFLIQMIGSGLNLSHWILDTSILYHVSLAPATSPDWTTNTVLVLLGILLITIGARIFNRRDLQAE